MENESPTPGTEVSTAAGGPGRKAEERTRSETVPDRQLGAGYKQFPILSRVFLC